jgi:CHAD domain-containing protein
MKDSMIYENLKFRLPDHYDQQQMITNLDEQFPIKPEPPQAVRLAFYDTFDWRLYNNALVLYHSEHGLFLRPLSDVTVLQQARITTPPVFVRDLPDGAMKDKLSAIIEMRALLKLAHVYCYTTTYRVLNQDEKTVVRLACEEYRPSDEQSAPVLAVYLVLKPVRGYDKNAHQIADHLKELELAITSEDPMQAILKNSGKTPGDYSGKLNIALSPDMRADEATKKILCFLLDIMKRNEPFIKGDVDTEFLHDFRVAVRRTRTALSQIKGVFPAEISTHFKEAFRTLGKLSNDLRDLDVYLLNEESYKALLPADMRDTIDPLFEYLQEKRDAALQHVINSLESRDYTRLIRDWTAFLQAPAGDSPAASGARRPIINVAQRRIDRVYRRIVTAGYRILENSDDELLHALRIECKKLRYLLEFFTSLFPEKKINALIKQLKQLQDNLGDFNDFDVQIEYLRKIAEELPLTGPRSRKTLLAIGRVIEKFENEKQAVKVAFVDVFTGFAAPANQAAFKQLFKPKKKEGAR